MLLIGLLVVAACSGPVPASDISLSPEDAYLDAVRDAEREWRNSFKTLGLVLEQSFGTRAILFQAVEEANFLESAETALSAAESLTPPPGYESDHERWLEYRRNVLDGTTGFDMVMRERDLLGLLSVIDTSAAAEAAFIDDISHVFCLVVGGHDPEFIWRCGLEEPVPGGDYGRAVERAMLDFSAAADTYFRFPLDMTDGERSARLDIGQPIIEAAFERALAEIEDLEPPQEFAGDHLALLTFLMDQLANAREITAANRAGDQERVLSLFRDSNDVFNELHSSIVSDDFRNLLASMAP